MTIGERVKELRLRRGWAQQDLAGQSGVSLATIVNTEIGKSYGRERTHMMFAQAFGLTLAEFLRPVNPRKKVPNSE